MVTSLGDLPRRLISTLLDEFGSEGLEVADAWMRNQFVPMPVRVGTHGAIHPLYYYRLEHGPLLDPALVGRYKRQGKRVTAEQLTDPRFRKDVWDYEKAHRNKNGEFVSNAYPAVSPALPELLRTPYVQLETAVMHAVADGFPNRSCVEAHYAASECATGVSGRFSGSHTASVGRHQPGYMTDSVRRLDDWAEITARIAKGQLVDCGADPPFKVMKLSGRLGTDKKNVGKADTIRWCV